MKAYLAVFTGTPARTSPHQLRWEALDEKARGEGAQLGMKAWHDWMEQHRAVIVDSGGPLGKTKLADARGVSDIANNLAGYVIVRAESHDAAARLFLNHPHFAIFPGDGVEIMECLPIPQQ